jgi:DNA ligase 1
VLFADVASTSAVVGATSSRKAKTAAIAELLQRTTTGELPIVATWLAGDLRQRRLGVGWATVFRDSTASSQSDSPTLDVADVDATFAALASTGGEGSQATRRNLLDGLFARATSTEAKLLRSMLMGELRQGALAGVVLDAIALAFGVPAASVRRAHLLSGDLGDAATAASNGQDALDAISLHVGRALQPMLASTSPSVTDAVTELGMVSVEWKLDGARIQVHRRGEDVWVFTRNLNDVTHRLPDVVALTRQLPVDSVVLDGEVLGLDGEGRPRSFQQTMSRFGTEEEAAPVNGVGLAPFFFDVMHVDGRDLLDEPLHVRLAELERFAPAALRVPGVITDDLDTALAVQADALGRGHEGVMVKAADSTYDAGRRGASWRKVKPVRTFDLVVLAVEWGSGRRQGWLSNLHLGARNMADDGFVMVGKTFKGMTDAILTWQTEELLAREVRRTTGTVWVRPELVVEIAIDGVQHSTRYPGGVALRFARVKGYRTDKSPAEADTIDALRALLP